MRGGHLRRLEGKELPSGCQGIIIINFSASARVSETGNEYENIQMIGQKSISQTLELCASVVAAAAKQKLK